MILLLCIGVEVGVLFDEILEIPLGKQPRELSKNLLLRPSRLHNQFMIDPAWVEIATVGPQAHAYQLRRELQISRYQFRRALRRARNIIPLMYRQRLVRRRRVHNATEKVMQDLNWHAPVWRAKEHIRQTTRNQSHEDRKTSIFVCFALGGSNSFF